MSKRLLIGDNAFIGVSHLSQSHARQRLQEIELGRLAETFDKAISCGANGFAFSTHETNYKILKALSDRGTLNSHFEVYPILPYAAGYVRTANEKGMRGLLDDVMSRLSFSGKAKALLKGSVSAALSDPFLMMSTYVDVELTAIQNMGQANLSSVLLHEVITDLGISFQSERLFDSYMRHIRDNYHVKPGFVTRNLVSFVKFFEECGLSLEGALIMTPVNKIGYQMNPSRESCETCLSHMKGVDVIAMSIMAAGYLELNEAVDYLQRVRNLSGVVVGVSSDKHAEETFTKLSGFIRSR